MKPYSISRQAIYVEENGKFYRVYTRITNYLPYMHDLHPDDFKKVAKVEEIKRERIWKDEYEERKDYFGEPISHTEPPENYQ